MMKSVLAALVLAISFSGSAFADDQKANDSKSTMKIDDAAAQKNKVAGDIDEEITNAKLRAESGSKSKWSGSVTAIYNGSSMATPFAGDRPNTNQEPTPPRVYLGGQIGARYRMTKNDSLALGTGYQVIRPFHDGKKGNVFDPYVAENHAQKFGGVQNSITTTVTGSTDRDELHIGQIGELDIANTSMYDFGGSKMSIGLAVEGTYNAFGMNKDRLVSDTDNKGNTVMTPAGGGQRDYILGIYPLAEYAFTDKVMLRTVFRPLIFNHQRILGDTQNSGWAKARWTQSATLFRATSIFTRTSSTTGTLGRVRISTGSAKRLATTRRSICRRLSMYSNFVIEFRS
jgi:opacity protein-like surface antigen